MLDVDMLEDWMPDVLDDVRRYIGGDPDNADGEISGYTWMEFVDTWVRYKGLSTQLAEILRIAETASKYDDGHGRDAHICGDWVRYWPHNNEALK